MQTAILKSIIRYIVAPVLCKQARTECKASYDLKMHLENKDAYSQRRTCQVSSDPRQIGSDIFQKRLVCEAD